MTTDRRFDALIFDLDGVILDTEAAVFDVWQSLFAEFGATVGRDEWQQLIGTTGGGDPFEWLRSRATRRLPTRPELETIARTREDRRASLLEALPGVSDWIDAADASGIALAVASSSPRAWVDARLEQVGLRARFATICTPDGHLRAKPAPDLYLEATRRLAVRPAAAIAVEDSYNGLSAAKQAGLAAIAVPNAMTLDMDLSAADLRLDSLAECPLEEAIERLSQDRPRRSRPATNGRAQP